MVVVVVVVVVASVVVVIVVVLVVILAPPPSFFRYKELVELMTPMNPQHLGGEIAAAHVALATQVAFVIYMNT